MSLGILTIRAASRIRQGQAALGADDDDAEQEQADGPHGPLSDLKRTTLRSFTSFARFILGLLLTDLSADLTN